MNKKEKLVIISDSREPFGLYNFSNFPDTMIIRDNLNVGDFSVYPYEKELCIERKTICDLSGSFTSGRERFEAEWKRSESYICKFLLIEGAFFDILSGNYKSKFSVNSFLGTLLSWSVKYRFSTIFVKTPREGSTAVYWICREFVNLKKKGEI